MDDGWCLHSFSGEGGYLCTPSQGEYAFSSALSMAVASCGAT
jgi:hypothetical protein